MTDPIHQLLEQNDNIRDILETRGEVSLQVAMEAYLAKLAVMAIGSYCESEMRAIVETFLREHSTDTRVSEFGVQKGVKRQYHTWFDWDSNRHTGVNKFFSLFGNSCKESNKETLRNERDLQEAAAAFIELGRKRNELAHENIISFSLPLTIDEIRVRYERAKRFLSFVRLQFSARRDAGAGDTNALADEATPDATESTAAGSATCDTEDAGDADGETGAPKNDSYGAGDPVGGGDPAGTSDTVGADAPDIDADGSGNPVGAGNPVGTSDTAGAGAPNIDADGAGAPSSTAGAGDPERASDPDAPGGNEED